MNPRALLTILLTLAALAASWWAWELRPQAAAEQVTGPQRGDYTAENYHLVVMNKEGDVSFRSHGPYAARDPNNQQLFVNQPKFSFPDKSVDADWTGHSEAGWVSAEGDEVRLRRSVVIDGPVIPDKDQMHIYSEQMNVFPDPQTAHSDVLVTIKRGASLSIGTGMNAWMKTSQVNLLSKVSIHDVPVPKN